MDSHPKVFALLAAAGGSSRMNLTGEGAARSKLLLTIFDKPLIRHTIERLCQNTRINNTVVIARAAELPQIKSCLADLPSLHYCEGGDTRQLSIRNGLDFLRTNFSPAPSDVVLIHDAARCLVSHELVERVLDVAVTAGAVSAAIPLVDSIAMADSNGRFLEPMDRRGVWQIQTPQAFRFDLVSRAHSEAEDRDQIDASDDSSLVMKIAPVRAVLGDKKNIKLTTPDDLLIIKALVNLDLVKK